MAAAETALEAHTARLRACEAEIELRREQHYATSDDVQRAQMHLADASATVARMEQQLLHLREKRQRLTQQVNQAKVQLDQLSVQRAQMEADAARLEEEATTAAEARLDAEAVLLALQEALPEHEAASEAARVALESAQLTLSHLRQTRQLAEQQVLHLERAMAQLLQRRDRLMAEQQALPSPDADALEDARLALETLSLVLEDATLELSALESALQTAEVERHEARQQRDATRTAYTAAHARHEALARLQAAQPAAGALRDWLARHGLADAPRLFEHLRIAPGWARAVEAVLRDRMQARCLPGTPTAEAPPARLTWIHREAISAVTVTPCPPELLALGQPLRAQVEAPTQFAPVLDDWLDRVLAVADDAALARVQPQLPPGWLAVAPSGHAASRHARIYHADDEAHAGLLQRQTEIAELAAHMATLAATLETLESRLHTAEEAVGQHHARLKHVRQRVDALRQQRGEQQVALARLTQAQEQADARRRQLADELADLQAEAETLALERETATLERDAASIGLPDAERAVEQARLACTEAETVLDLHRSRLRQAERQVQEIGFACQSAAQQRAALVRRLDDLAQQAEETRMRREDASFELAEMDEGSFNDSFQAALDARAERERALAAARDAANQATNRLREAELEKQQIEQGFEPIREQLGSLQLKAQEARLSLERFEQELREAGADETALAPLLNEGVKVQQLVGEIGRLSQQIHALGNVNLAAIDELKAAQARKTYLDAQADDLNAAIETLESAIRKIDRETRTMLQDTFNQVNANLQELFPMLFGGGHAELMLTGEEILDAGVQIMAQPPGKKNATIHLLSGGEKALTALSLVFALFRLNPAPFCLLDEVDAPLDDANTSRFCEMVKRMAERTQFLYISHNKLTMEMADQLVGITMQEKGVSRVVAVDIEAALQMRETA
jgi:chromosome segregation protein